LADEEIFHIVVGVDEPVGYASGSVAMDFASVGVEDVYVVNPDLYLTVSCVEDVDVRLAYDFEDVASTDILQVVGHVQVCVRANFE